MPFNPKEKLLQMETTCGSLLYELQVIWDEVGESEEEKDRLLLEVEQECLEVYRRKVNNANRLRVELHQAIADSEAELAAICSVLGEPPVHVRKSDRGSIGLKEQLANIGPRLDTLRRKKVERCTRLQEVAEQIQKIRNEIGSDVYSSPFSVTMDDSDLSMRRLEDLQKELERLQKEKTDRLKHVIDHLSAIYSLCLVLGMDFKRIVGEVHPSLADSEGVKDFSNITIEMLASAKRELQAVKRQRIQKLQDLVTSMLELWHLMDTPAEEQELFHNITCNIAASEDEIMEADALSENLINRINTEVSRLEQLKTSKIKELVLRKKSELEELRRQAHIVVDSQADDTEYFVEAIESGVVAASLILEQIEVEIANTKEDAYGRKEILEKAEKWMAACDEESWLEEYNADETRYSAGKGAHLVLKRAEKARAISSKIPAMVENLVAKTTAWENEKGVEFNFDGVRLLTMLEEYSILREEKEQALRRQRDQRRLQGQLIAEQEVLYGAKAGSSKTQTTKKPLKVSTGITPSSSKRLSLGGAYLQATRPELMQSPKATPHSARKADDGERERPTSGRGIRTRQLSFNSSHTSDIEVPLPRRPFTPIVPIPSPAALVAEDENQQTKTAPHNAPASIPNTMKISRTTDIAPAADDDDKHEHRIEYSFEEQRAGYTLPLEQLKC